jgi:hypothetical protein
LNITIKIIFQTNAFKISRIKDIWKKGRGVIPLIVTREYITEDESKLREQSLILARKTEDWDPFTKNLRTTILGFVIDIKLKKRTRKPQEYSSTLPETPPHNPGVESRLRDFF